MSKLLYLMHYYILLYHHFHSPFEIHDVNGEVKLSLWKAISTEIHSILIEPRYNIMNES